MRCIFVISRAGFILIVALLSVSASAQDLLVDSGDYYIDTPQTYDNVEVWGTGRLFVNALLTVNDDMIVLETGVVTHSQRNLTGLQLDVADTLLVAGTFDVTAKGLTGGVGGFIGPHEGETYDPERQTELIERSFVSPDYFEAMGIPLLAGRAMEGNEGTDAERVAVVNRAFVDLYWPNQNALGQRIRQDAENPEWSSVVVGVVENVRQWGAEHRPLPEIYQPYRHFPEPDSKLIIRGNGSVLSMVPAIRQQVLDL